MGWERTFYDDAGAYFNGRIKALRPTLLELYHKTRAYEAERAESARRIQLDGVSIADLVDPAAGKAMLLYHDLIADANALADSADAYGQAFIMVVNPALLELQHSVVDAHGLGPVVCGEIHLAQALMEVANAIRHRHKFEDRSLKALHRSAGTKHFTGVLASLGINAKHVGGAKAFLTKWGPPTYREFEDRLFRIGLDASEQFPDK